MATRQLIVSDVGGEELTDETHTKVHVKHPDNPSVLELDLSADEAAKLVNTSLRLIEFTIYEPNKPPRTAVMESKVVDKLFTGVDFDGVLASARKVQTAATPPSQRRPTSVPKATTTAVIDYTSPEHAGKLHRGRLTDAEKDWVKANRDKASYNREQQTGKPIDFDDPAEIKRYGL